MGLLRQVSYNRDPGKKCRKVEVSIAIKEWNNGCLISVRMILYDSTLSEIPDVIFR